MEILPLLRFVGDDEVFNCYAFFAVEVFTKWPGVILNGDLPLQRFVGGDEESEKRLIHQMSDHDLEDRFFS